MIVEIGSGWTVEIEHGPDWMFGRLHSDAPYDTRGLEFAETIYRLLDQEFGHRLVLEMDDVPHLTSEIVGQLVLLHKRITSRGGLIRLSGLSDANYDVLSSARLAGRFPRFHNRQEAVHGFRPNKPK